MPSLAERILSALIPGISGLRADVNALQAQMGAVMATQAAADAKLAAIGDGVKAVATSVSGIATSVDGLAADIEFLKGNVTPGEPVSEEFFERLSQVAEAAAALQTQTGDLATKTKALDDAFTPPTT